VRNGALFAVFALRIRQLAEKEGMVQILLSITRVAPAPLLQNKSEGTSLIGAGKLSRYRIFIGGTGAVSRRRPWPKRSNLQGYKIFIAGTGAESGL